MNNIIISALDEQFKKDCKVINLKYEYPGYTGIEQWAIITDLSEEDLCTKYAEQIAPFRPYILLSASFGVVRDDYRRNEKKHQMRATRNIDAFHYDDELTTSFHHELIDVSTEDMPFPTGCLLPHRTLRLRILLLLPMRHRAAPLCLLHRLTPVLSRYRARRRRPTVRLQTAPLRLLQKPLQSRRRKELQRVLEKLQPKK